MNLLLSIPMRRLSFSFSLVAVLVSMLVATATLAQDAPSPPTRGVREVLPELYYMQDDAGRLVPVPGFQYRDFVDLFRIKEGLAGPVLPPAAVLERVTTRIDARGLTAKATSCPAVVTCVVRQSRGGWAAVPLDLGGLLLDEPPKHEGPGGMLVDAAPNGEGYRVWFDPPADGSGEVRHTVTLSGRLPAEVLPTQESFDLRLPAAIASHVEIRSSRPNPIVTLRPDAAGRVETASDADGSVATITGLAGRVRIRIASAAAPMANASITEATCTSTVRIDRRTATIAATLRVKELPTKTRRLSIALPPRTTLLRVGGDATLVARKGTADQPAVDVAVERSVDGTAAIEIDCEEPVDPSGRTPLEILGFAVSGVEPWRQSGRVSLVVDGDWQATWQDTPGIRRVDPPSGERPTGFVATFAYDVQPASMSVRIRPRRSRVLVEPEYRYDVSTSRIELTARLRVAARGAPVSSILLVLDPEWVVEDVGPVTLVDSAGVRTEDDRITIPFIQPLTGDAVIELRAVESIDPGADRVAWTMPVPQADLVGPAMVVVSADADIDLLPDVAAMTGLVRQTASAVEPGDAERIALAYRLDTTEGEFAATRRFLPRRVESNIVARVDVDDREIAVEEILRLSVFHVPLEFLEVSVPEALATNGSLEVRQGETTLEITEAITSANMDAAGEPLRVVRVFLPVPLLGNGTVSIRYRMPVPRLPREATVAIDVPMPLPVVTASGRQEAVIDEASSVVVAVRGETWRREISGQSSVASRTYSAPKPQHLLPLAVSVRTRQTVSVTVVEAAWLQTRLFPDVREDITTFVVSGPGGPLDIRLPSSSVDATTLEIRLDGEPVEDAVRNGSEVLITLPDGALTRRLIEIRSSAPWGGTAAGLGLPWPLLLETPEFADAVLQRRFYREVLVSTDDHVLGAPSRWTSQQRWAWTGSGWHQMAAVTPGELAKWVTTSSEEGRASRSLLADEPSLRQRRFVFAGIGSPQRAVVWVVPTWFLVLVASGAALGIGLVLVYQEAFRQTSVLLAITASGMVVAATMPDTAVLMGQAAIPGGVMAVLAAVLRRAFDEPVTRSRVVVPQSTSSLSRASSPTVSLVIASHPESGSTTTAAVGRDT